MNNFLERRIDKMIGEIEGFVTPVRINVSGWKTIKCGYKTGNTVPSQNTADWCDFGETERWGTDVEEHRWFYKHIEIPEELKGKDIELYIAATPVSDNDWEPQFMVYLDGKLIRGIDSNHRYVKLDSNKDGYDVHVYAYSRPFGQRTDFYSQICLFNRDIERLYYNLNVPYEIMEYLTEEDKAFCDIRNYLNNALNMLNWCSPMSDEFIESVKLANNYLETEFYGKYCHDQDVKISCVGHTHIDVAWQWTLDQTREKVQRTFGSVIEMMKKYPDYKFMSSQPQLFKYLKEESPEMYAEVKRLVKEGRIEPEGSMWLEADCNLTSGESLVRQILFGKRFFKKEFDVDNKIVWLPDVFGYSAAMPQIMKKSGIDKFVTSKIAWNETNRMPYDTFMWKGIDGSEVFTYFLTAVERRRNFEKMGWRSTYTPMLNPAYVQGAWDRYEPKAITNELLMPFGYGDGGGGPADWHIENFNRLKCGINGCPQVRWEFASEFLERMKNNLKDNKRLPQWSGELYLEFHRGTYTSQARNKRNNRKSEQLYQNTEMISSIAGKLTGLEYPQNELNEGWECILLNQFHDIIPGSSIRPVYEQCAKDYAMITGKATTAENKAYSAVLDNIKTDGGVAIFNMNSFVSNGFVQYNGKTYRVDSIPSKGYKVVKLAEQKSNYKLDGNCLETSNYIVEFGKDFTITRLFDKVNSREVIREGGRANYIEAFEDYPYEYDAWELSNYYTEKRYEVDDVSKAEFIDEGARFGFEITRKFYKSVIKQKIYFYDNSPRIDFDTYADWHQEHLMLKAAFDVDVNSDKATYEIQFGSVERPVHKNTSWDAAKFEVCAHKYMDYSDYGYGVSLLNDCKYGHNIENGTMKLSMFKCATNPDPDADKGEHRFIYSIVPHAGSFKESGVVQTAYELNYPLKAFEVKKQNGSLGDEYSLLSCNKDNFIVETIKKAEDSDAIIARGYESYNKRTDITLKFGFDVKKAYICDLMENETEELDINNNSVNFIAKPFEIITVKAY
jgi:alpha-mannosidase